MTVVPSRSDLTPEAAAEKAVAAIGCGYDLCCDFSFSYVKPGLDGSRLIELDQTLVHDLVMPGGVVVPNVPKAIKCDRVGRTRYRSDVLSFNQVPNSQRFITPFWYFWSCDYHRNLCFPSLACLVRSVLFCLFFSCAKFYHSSGQRCFLSSDCSGISMIFGF